VPGRVFASRSTDRSISIDQYQPVEIGAINDVSMYRYRSIDNGSIDNGSIDIDQIDINRSDRLI
jgi:hypothetical protein